MEKKFDEILKAPHYNQSDIECIDAIKAALSPEEFRGALKFQVMKYLWRAEHKIDGNKDTKKAKYYMDKLAELNNETLKVTATTDDKAIVDFASLSKKEVPAETEKPYGKKIKKQPGRPKIEKR